MANTYAFSNADNTVAVRSPDKASIPWDAVANQPIDVGGSVGQQWIADGSPIPAPFIATVKPEVETGEMISRWTNAEFRLLQDRRMSDNGKLGKDWETITSDPIVLLTKQKVQNMKADLVAAGVLTAERADIIFSPGNIAHAR